MIASNLRYSLVLFVIEKVSTIEQLQFTGDESTSTVNTKVKLNFNHPSKELVWVVQPDDFRTNVDNKYGKQWFNFTDDWDETFLSTSAYSSNAEIVDPDAARLAGGMPGIAPGGANRVFVPTSFEGGANPVSTAKLQLNGHDRFSERDGRYFNLVQPYQHHENVPSRGINVYSFGLKPEEHQPSGTCNMSRIDSAVLSLNLTAKTVNGRSAVVKVFCCSYNVLRIMSGMGGLAWLFRAVKLHLIVIVSWRNPATLSNCGKTFRYSPSFSKAKLCEFRQSASKPKNGKVQRLNDNGSVLTDRLKIQSIPLKKFKGSETPIRYFISQLFLLFQNISFEYTQILYKFNRNYPLKRKNLKPLSINSQTSYKISQYEVFYHQ